MKLWVGLGNPGTAYAKNRHNVGFMAVDRLADAYSFSGWKRSGSAETCSGLVGRHKCSTVGSWSRTDSVAAHHDDWGTHPFHQ